MNSIQTEADGQMMFSTERCKFLMVPSFLDGFNNSCTTVESSKSGREVFYFNGTLDDNVDRNCPVCGGKMHVNNHECNASPSLLWQYTHGC